MRCAAGVYFAVFILMLAWIAVRRSRTSKIDAFLMSNFLACAAAVCASLLFAIAATLVDKRRGRHG